MKFQKKKTFLLLLLLAGILLFSQPVWARAGGGGSGSSGGSGESGGSSGSNHDYSSGSSSSRSTPLSSLFSYTMIILITGGSTFVFTYKASKAKQKSKRLMKSYKDPGENWDYREIQAHVEKAYFIIQECWKRYDPSYASDYLSEELASEWRSKLEWIRIRNEEIVQENVKLISAKPVYVHNEEGKDQDYIWYLIHGRMTGYYRDKTTLQVVKGNPHPESFYEYWMFIRRNGNWVLHKICQKDEINIDELTNQ